jgi:hypothetical protein
MKCGAAIALSMMAIAFPLCAQRGVSHGGFRGGQVGGPAMGSPGGFSGHSAPMPGNSFRTSVPPPTHQVMPRYPAPGHMSDAHRLAPPGSMRIPANYGGQFYRRDPNQHDPSHHDPGNHDPNHHGSDHHDHHSPYRRPYTTVTGVWPWGVPGGTWIGPGYMGYADDGGYDDTAAYPNENYPAENYLNEGYDGQSVEEGPPMQRAPYRSSPESAAPQSEPQASPENGETVKLIFKDGRPSEDIHNYILSRTNLLVLDQKRREIPVAQLDVAATEKVNRESGVDFHLPEALR